jgi:phage FluMu protein Com
MDRCPSCGVLLSGVKCEACGYVGGKSEFAFNGNRCPRCNSISYGSSRYNSSKPFSFSGSGFAKSGLIVIGIILLILSCVMSVVAWGAIDTMKDYSGLYMVIGMVVLGILAITGGALIKKKG